MPESSSSGGEGLSISPVALHSLRFLVFLTTALWATGPLVHDDVFYHLRAGEQIIESGSIPKTDSFSYTRTGAQWVTHEWGFEALVFLVYSIGGLGSLVLLKMGLALLLVFLLERLFQLGLPRPYRLLTPIVVLACVWAMRHTFVLRPALLSSLFLTGALSLLERWRRVDYDGYPLGLAPIFLVWANVHSGVVFGFLLIGAYLAAAILRGSRVGRHSLVLLGAVALSVCNPNGLDALLYPIALNRFFFHSGLEFDYGIFTAPTTLDHPGFFVLGAIALAGLLRRGSWRDLPLASTLATIGFLVLSLRSNRFVAHFAVTCVPMLAALYGCPSCPVWRRPRALLGVTGTGIAIALLLAATSHEGRMLHPKFPEGAVRFVQLGNIDGTLYNSQNLGGFLGWRLRRPVFWDGRNLLFAPISAEASRSPFARVVYEYGIDYIIIDRRDYAILHSQLVPPVWQEAYADEYSFVFVRRRK